jgi:hypothetical protein
VLPPLSFLKTNSHEKICHARYALSNTGRTEYGIQNIAILIDESQMITVISGRAHHNNFRILEISHEVSSFPWEIIDCSKNFSTRYCWKKNHKDQKIPADSSLLESEVFRPIFSYLLETKLPKEIQSRKDYQIRARKEGEEWERIRSQTEKVLEAVTQEYRVWIKLRTGRKAVVDQKKLMVYNANTLPYSLKKNM